jgi:hypothetical protein
VSTARLGRYVAWQTLDFLRERGLAIALILSALTLAAGMIGAEGPEAGFSGAAGLVRLSRFTLSLVTSISLLFLVVGFNGLCSADRTQGFARFYFAKPVDPSAFYGLKWLVHAVGLGVIVLAWTGTLAAVYGPYDAAATLVAFGLRLMLYGGLFFLLSVLLSAEVAAFSGLYLGGELAKLLADDRAWARTAVTWAFPWHRLTELDALLEKGAALPLDAVLHVTGTGLGALVLGLVLLRRRRLVT